MWNYGVSNNACNGNVIRGERHVRKEKRNREVQQDVAGKMNLSKDDIFKNLIIEYASSRMDLIIRLRQKRITDAEFMAYVDESLKK